MTRTVVNSDDVERIERSHGESFASRQARLADAAGSENLGCTLYDVEPGYSQCPYHFHAANEEALYVLAGEGTLRTHGGEIDISEGDYVAFQVGEEGAHRITNTSDGTLRYLIFSTKRDPEIYVYPDSDKIAVRGYAPGAPTKILLTDTEEVDYWEGET